MLFVTAGIRSADLFCWHRPFYAEWSSLAQAVCLVKSRLPMVHWKAVFAVFYRRRRPNIIMAPTIHDHGRRPIDQRRRQTRRRDF
jgi:hypothetical protein